MACKQRFSDRNYSSVQAAVTSPTCRCSIPVVPSSLKYWYPWYDRKACRTSSIFDICVKMRQRCLRAYRRRSSRDNACSLPANRNIKFCNTTLLIQGMRFKHLPQSYSIRRSSGKCSWEATSALWVRGCSVDSSSREVLENCCSRARARYPRPEDVGSIDGACVTAGLTQIQNLKPTISIRGRISRHYTLHSR